MKIVIDIPYEDYIRIKETGVIGKVDVFKRAIRNGTVLPKGHGNLKDMGNLKYVFDLTKEDTIYSGKDIERAIKSMKTIIEADREVKHE